MSGLRKPTAGEIYLDDRAYSKMPERERVALRRSEFGFVFQQHFLINYLTALENVMMPGMSGLELLEKIRTTYEKPPPVVMMITAYGDDHNRTMAEKLGANDFLTKPMDFSKLKEKLNSLN